MSMLGGGAALGRRMLKAAVERGVRSQVSGELLTLDNAVLLDGSDSRADCMVFLTAEEFDLFQSVFDLDLFCVYDSRSIQWHGRL